MGGGGEGGGGDSKLPEYEFLISFLVYLGDK